MKQDVRQGKSNYQPPCKKNPEIQVEEYSNLTEGLNKVSKVNSAMQKKDSENWRTGHCKLPRGAKAKKKEKE